MPRPAPLAVVSCLLVLVAAACALARVQEVDVEMAKKVKAAYLYKFMKFVTWPAECLGQDTAPMVIGVVGRDPFGEVLDETIRDKTAGGRAIEVRRLAAAEGAELPPREALRACHLIFVSDSEQPRLAAVFEALEGSAVLTVSDIEHFARGGGAIELALEAPRIIFKVNRVAAEKAGLKLSAKLLSLAKIVEESDGATKPKGSEGLDAEGPLIERSDEGGE